jgi:membrane protease YdiL (CAAX protease family)
MDDKKEKEIVIAQILYLFVIPVLLLYFNVIPGEYRYLVLFVCSLLLVGIVKHNNWTKEDFGLNRSLAKDFLPYLTFTILGVLFLFLLREIVPVSPKLNWGRDMKFLLLFIPVSVFQEIAFRGILMNMLIKAFKSPIFIIGINALVFALIHIIYMNITITLPLTFIAGVGFAWIYYKYKNLILISISHTILNFIAMILGFFIIR